MVMDALLEHLRARAAAIDAGGAWPGDCLDALGRADVYRWFVPESHGGWGWSDAQIVSGYASLARANLTTAFILTQRSATSRRIATSSNEALRDRLLPDLASGRTFATVGVSHLSTSRRHLGRPAVRATRTATGYRLEGTSWWVTGAAYADHVLVGAQMDDQELLVVVPARAVEVDAPGDLVALTASCTAAVHLRGVEVAEADVVAGPLPRVFEASRAGGTAGLQTSALALGLARAASDFLGQEAQRRPNLGEGHRALMSRLDRFEGDLLAFAEGDDAHTKETLRFRVNDLVLGATQAALVAAKGAGHLAGQAPGRWCREALFFLVWSLPERV